ncbi:DJ-1/PfpI family protein [candidate division KSB1 bacterium]
MGPADNNKGGREMLFIMGENFGGNYFLYGDVFEQYGWTFIHAGVGDTLVNCPFINREQDEPFIITDIKVNSIANVTEYDGVAVMASSTFFSEDPLREIMDSPDAINLLKTANANELPVLALCAGVRVLAAADVIRGKSVVGHPKFQSEYETAGATFLGNDHPPIIDGNIITGVRGQYYSHANALAVITYYEDRFDKKGDKEHKNNIIIEQNADIGNGTVWSKTFGGSYAEGGRDICETADGGYLISGYTFSQGNGDPDVLVVKTDAEGSMEWSKSFGGAGSEYGMGCTAVKEGYLVTGYTTSSGSGSKDVYLLKIDKNGSLIWSKTYGGQSWEVGTDVIETESGEYIICGYTHSFGEGEEDVYLIKTDRNGNEIWSKTYGGDRVEMGNSVYETGDRGFIIGAATGTFGGGNSDQWVIRTDGDGNVIWTKNYAGKGPAGHGFDWNMDLCLSSDGGAFIAGYSDCDDLMDAVVVKIGPDGNEIWQKAFGKNPYYDYGNSVIEGADGSVIVAGTTKSIVRDRRIYNNDFYIVKLNRNGEIMWEKTIGGEFSDWGSRVITSKDGGYIVLGQTISTGNGSYDVCLFKVSDK